MNIYDPANDIVYVHLAQQPRDPEIGVRPLPPRVAPRTPPRPQARRAIQLVGEEVFPVAREVLGAADAPRVTLGVRPEDLEVVEPLAC